MLARSDFINSIELSPNNPIAYNNLAVVYQYLGNFEESKKCLLESLKLKPTDPNILNNLGLLQLNAYELEDAANSFRKSLNIKNNPIVRSNLAFCLFELDDIDLAISEWERSLEELELQVSDWDGLDAMAGLAVVLYQKGFRDAAIKQYKQVLDAEPGYEDPTLLAQRYFWPKKIRKSAIQLLSILNTGKD